MKTLTLEVNQPSTGPVCPGQEVILTCTVQRVDAVSDTILTWQLKNASTNIIVRYNSNNIPLTPQILGDFITTAVFITTTTSSTALISNITLASAAFSNNNSSLSCISPPDHIQTTNLVIAGTYTCY